MATCCLAGPLLTLPSAPAPAGEYSTSAAAPLGGRSNSQGAGVPDARPNIVLITTDDQRASDLRFMPRTRRLLGARGTAFFGLSPHPLCCPARAEILTGQFAHNNGVRSNRGPLGGYQALDRERTVATWLQGAGYATALMGKHLNGYGRERDPEVDPGWSSWHVLARQTYDYWSFAVNHNGTLLPSRGIYQTDYFTRLAAREIQRLGSNDQPFFLWQSYLAPHRGSDSSSPTFQAPSSAPRHRQLFRTLPLGTRNDPAFDEGDVRDKPTWVRRKPLLGADGRHRVLLLHRARLRALRAVDEGVGRTIRSLRRVGELHNTIVIFTSDNGLLLGEHRLTNKNSPYEQAMRVPLLIRGPGFPAGRRTSQPGTTVDLAATIVAAAGATPSWPLDGQDLQRVVGGTARGVETVLIQAGPRNRRQDEVGWFYRGVRTPRYTYVRYLPTDEEELYDRRLDPHQLVNVAGDPAYAEVQTELQARLAALGSCAGEQCRQRFGPVAAPQNR